ncbi:MAG TPA: gamma-glutamyltransferase family protein [Phycisphaerales bacterium]|nr:gamma-glutamyltransferase family protein [Phycisphaerales bacterium]HIN83560.1 gamma-glutamyltransferase family protein [Phycisphaerales bacterium]HIO52336.1 gamma-glutamyltransferase family protein [Phycisphaerales bacterium]
MIDWSLPYASSREAVLGKNVVACSQPLAAQAGLQMMRIGGNAVDAALASAIASTVVEPCANGIGGDAFAIVQDENGIHGINGSGKSPALMPTSIEGEIPSVGWLPVTVPGEVATWVMLHKKFCKLPFATLFEPAISYARNGFLVSPQTATRWKNGTDRFRSEQAWCDTFLFDGKAPEVGQLITLPDHANTLQEIAETNGESFYRGNLANKMDEASKAGGGFLRKEDLAAHESEWVSPLAIGVGDATFYELPPNGQGIAALIAMKIVQESKVDLSDCDNPSVLHIQIEAMKRAFSDTHAFVADPEISGDCGDLLEDERIKKHCATIHNEATVIDANAIPRYASTVYLATGDENGMQCSFIQSNFEGFGSGMVVPGTGIALQNRGRGFSLDPKHPNCIGPNKRPFHTIIPAFLKRGEGKFSGTPFGVMGGPMQPQGHLQVVCRMLFANQNPQSALDAPRWKLIGNKKVAIESGFAESVYEELRSRGHELEIAQQRTVAFGGGQIIHGITDGYAGASDSRRDGQAVTF